MATFKSFFGLTLEVSETQGKVTLKQHDYFCRSWWKNQTELRAIRNELRCDSNEDLRVVVGWMIVSLLDGNHIRYMNTSEDKLQMQAQEIGNLLADLREESLRKHPIRQSLLIRF